MRTIGLTGAIASGKTTVAELLRDLGAPVIDADLQVSRRLTAPGGPALPAIRQAFGDEVFAGTELDRGALAARIFGSEAERLRLNAIMFPLIVQGLRELLERLANEGVPAAVVDLPLLYEMGFDHDCDEVWVCALPEELRMERLMRRNHLSREAALQRMASQASTAELVARADRALDTAAPPEGLRAQVAQAWREAINKQ